MVQLKNRFDVRKFMDGNGNGEYDELPEGVYRLMLASTGRRTSKAGNDMLALGWKVAEGPHKDRALMQLINLWHPKWVVRDIAFEELARVCHALGFEEIKPALFMTAA